MTEHKKCFNLMYYSEMIIIAIVSLLSSNTGFYVQITKFESNTGNLLNVFVTVVKQDDRQDTTIVSF